MRSKFWFIAIMAVLVLIISARSQEPAITSYGRVVDAAIYTGVTWPKQNGVCPVCWAVAEKYVRTPIPRSICPEVIIDPNATIESQSHGTGKQVWKACMTAAERLVRCKRCNAAFWQDAEAVK